MIAPSKALITASKIRTYFQEYREVMPMITVYDSPSDIPGVFVARVWRALPTPMPTDLHFIYESLEHVQQAVDALGLSLAWLPRQPADDPSIVGVWI